MTSASEAFLLQVGTRIANARHAKDLTQSQLADEIGVDARSLQRIEAGRSAPSLQRLRDIADVLDVQISRLLEGRPPARTSKRRGSAREERARRDEHAALLRLWERVPKARRPFALKVLRLLCVERLE